MVKFKLQVKPYWEDYKKGDPNMVLMCQKLLFTDENMGKVTLGLANAIFDKDGFENLVVAVRGELATRKRCPRVMYARMTLKGKVTI